MVDFIHDIPEDEYDKLSHYYWLAVIGSREYNDYNAIASNIEYVINALIKHDIIATHKEILIVSGKAIGVDSRAKEYADKHDIMNVNIKPDWKRFGNSAGMKRNPNIIKYARRVIAFQLDKSRGTQGGIDYARKKGIKVHVIPICCT